MLASDFYWLDVPLETRSWVLDTDDSSDSTQFRLRLMRGELISRRESIQLHQVRGPRPAVDFSLSVLGIPVVSARAREVLEKAAGADIDLVPAAVTGTAKPFFVLNILHVLDVLDHDASTFSTYDGPERFNLVIPVISVEAMGKHGIVRVKGAPTTIIVTRGVATSLEESRITGIELLPLESR